MFVRCWLTGGIPKELGALSKLERLWLRGNQLSGESRVTLATIISITWWVVHACH